VSFSDQVGSTTFSLSEFCTSGEITSGSGFSHGGVLVFFDTISLDSGIHADVERTLSVIVGISDIQSVFSQRVICLFSHFFHAVMAQIV